MSTTRLPADARRRSLQDAAEQQLLEHGYTATRLDDIARAAGVTRQLLQRHFPTKSALFLSLLDRHRDGLLAIISNPPTQVEDRRSSASAAARAWFGYVHEHPFVAAFLFDDATGDPANAQRHLQMRDAARNALQRALQDQMPAETPAVHLEALAEMVRSSAVGLARWHSNHPQLSADALADLAVDRWLAALQPLGECSADQNASGTTAGTPPGHETRRP
ncbi:MAG: TetR/AcrR family transcriptional regulator [Solirubrobacteraceae bacterium]|nr:TetR/AcrR family transcriptional regulator [Solirubrobacteraceae bacterium]